MKYPIPRPSKYAVRVGRSSSGFGLFAKQDIPTKQFVIEYWGKIVTDKEADRITGKYLYGLDNGRNIAGALRKNVARYVNHACRPNCEPRQVGDRIFIYSKKNIKAGEELTYNYGKEYFDAFITKAKCRCTSCVKRRQA